MSFKQFSGAVNSLLPPKLGDDVRKNIKAAVRATLENMELVTREELEVQEQVLLKTRQKLESLENRVAELEALVEKLQAGN